MAALEAGDGWKASGTFADWPGIGSVSRSLRSIGLGETATAWREDPADPRNRRVLVYHCMTAGPEQEALPPDQEAAADLLRQST